MVFNRSYYFTKIIHSIKGYPIYTFIGLGYELLSLIRDFLSYFNRSPVNIVLSVGFGPVALIARVNQRKPPIVNVCRPQWRPVIHSSVKVIEFHLKIKLLGLGIWITGLWSLFSHSVPRQTGNATSELNNKNNHVHEELLEDWEVTYYTTQQLYSILTTSVAFAQRMGDQSLGELDQLVVD